MNVTNRQINILDICPEYIKESILKYWEMKNDEFSNKPKIIAESLEIQIHEISILVRKYSKFTFEISCNPCKENSKHTVYSQSAFKMITRKSEYTCQSCLDLIKKNESIEAEKKLKETIKSLRGAIKNKKWEELNRFEFKIL